MKKISLSIYAMAILTFSDAMALESNYFHQLHTKQHQLSYVYAQDTLHDRYSEDWEIGGKSRQSIQYMYGYNDQLSFSAELDYVTGNNYRKLMDATVIDGNVNGIEGLNLQMLGRFDLDESSVYLGMGLNLASDFYRLNASDLSANASLGQHVLSAHIGYLTKLNSFKLGANVLRTYKLPGKAIFTDHGKTTSIRLTGGGQSVVKLFVTIDNQYQTTFALVKTVNHNTLFDSTDRVYQTSSNEFDTTVGEVSSEFKLNEKWFLLPSIGIPAGGSTDNELDLTQFKAELRYLF